MAARVARAATLAAVSGCAIAIATPAMAEPETCAAGVCTIRLTAEQLLAKAEQLVRQRRFDEARPLLVALTQAPQVAMQTRFLTGYVAVESGDLSGAIKQFRALLVDHPEQTRVRLELARAMMLSGKYDAADHNFRLAEEDSNLPNELRATIQSTRGILRDRRWWTFNLDLGLAPDTNITGGTSASTVDVVLGGSTIPLTLDDQARARSGIGETAGVSGGLRLALGGQTRLLIDGDGQGVNYKGAKADDFSAQLAVGPEFRLSQQSTVSVQGLGAQRWYGGQVATRAFGLRAGFQHNFDAGQRIGVSIDGRRSESGFADAYSGWQVGGYATYERVVAHAMIASATVFARREALQSRAYSNSEYGANLGVGGELPLGINAGISGGLSRATYDAPLPLFSTDPRGDWRWNARINLGLRSIRVLGFSPSVTYSFTRNASTLALNDSVRHRLRFGLARYF